MKILNNRNTLSLQMIYAGYHCAGKEWCYENIISPFSRLYLINEGKAAVYMNKKKYELSPGELFIIPKFTFHTYECDNFMNHYYICFFRPADWGQKPVRKHDHTLSASSQRDRPDAYVTFSRTEPRLCRPQSES